MKITIRLIVSLVFVVAMVVFVFSLYQANYEKNRLARDLERRSIILAESLQESIAPLIQSNAPTKLNRIVERFGNRERLKGIAVFDKQGMALTLTAHLKQQIAQPFPQSVNSVAENRSMGSFMNVGAQRMYIYTIPIYSDDGSVAGALTTFNDILTLTSAFLKYGKTTSFVFHPLTPRCAEYRADGQVEHYGANGTSC